MNIIETSWKWNGGLSSRPRTDFIVLHHAAAETCSAAQVDSWHKSNGWSGIGYHFFVRRDGTIYRGRPLWSMGAHVSGMNNCSIGICAEGDYDKERTMPAAQMAAIKELLRDLKSDYPNAKIVGHKEIGSSDCPGRYYPLDELKNNYMNGEGLTMAQYEELKQLIAAQNELIEKQNKEIAAIKAAIGGTMIYNYIDENMPDWAAPAVRAAVYSGAVQGSGENGELGLTYKDLCQIVREHRAGLYR